jgi:hypothetical protein
MPKKTKEPVPLAQRVRASETRKIGAGGRRLPGSILPPDASAALEKLVNEAYGDSATACIARALVEAAERMRPSKPVR